MKKRLFLVERVQRIVVSAVDQQAAETLAVELHGDDLRFRSQTFARVPHEITKAEHAPAELLEHPPFSDGICHECGDDHEDEETVEKILATRGLET